MTDTKWFVRLGVDELGPISAHELAILAQQGAVTPSTPVSPDRLSWAIAASVEGLTFQPAKSGSRCAGPKNGWLGAGASQARLVIGDLRQMKFWQEVIPLDAEIVRSISKSFVFWAALFLGVVPLLIGTLTDIRLQLTAFAVFFAVLWATIFKLFIVRDRGDWRPPVAALLFSGVIGTNVLLFLYYYVFPKPLLALATSQNHVVSLIGCIGQIGVCEELCKITPVLAYVLWKRSAAQPATIVLMGVFSGLGFAAFENLGYGDLAVKQSHDLATSYGAEGLAIGVQAAVASALLRSLSTVFVHAVITGIFAYFIAVANFTNRRQSACVVVGLSIAAVVHGFYDWLILLQPTMAAVTMVAAFVLFCGYLKRLEELTLTPGRVLSQPAAS